MTFPVHRDGIRWIVTIPYQHRDKAKSAGFRWCPLQKHWWTSREDVAKLLMDPAAQAAKKSEFERIGKERAALVDESRAASADVELPAPHGLEYLPFQRAGIVGSLKRFGIDIAYLQCDNGLRKKDDAKGSLPQNSEPTCRVGGEPGQRTGTGSTRTEHGVVARDGARPGMASACVGGDKEGHAQTGSQGQASGRSSRPEVEPERRERNASDAVHSQPVLFPVSSGMDSRVRHQDERSWDGRDATPELQGRLRAPGSESSDRSGWTVSQQSAPAGEGQEKNSSSAISRMASHTSASHVGGGVLLGDSMGLGKTIQLIGIINAVFSIRRVLIVCPATLKQNWQRELNKWLVRKFRIGIATGQSWPGGYADIVIMNFDIATKHAAKIQAELWDLVAIDEAHYLKNRESKRTLAIFGMDPYTAKRQKVEPSPGVRGRLQVGMTGTPIPNRPSEGFGLFHWLAPDHEIFKSFYLYAKKFTGSFTYPGAGYDSGGATNLDELQRELRGSIMIRRTKTQVLTELPAKRRVVIELEADSASDAIADESEAAEAYEEELERLRAAVELAKAESESAYTEAVAALKKGASFAFTEMARLRHETAMATLPHAVEHVLTALKADESHKVVVFCHHGDVAAGMLSALAEEQIGTASITQKTPIMERQAESDRFQTDPDCRVFVGGIQSAGVGITLTAAWHVVFVELDWVPGNMSQAEDRCNRIGQRNSVLCEHLVIQGSIAATMAKRLVSKQTIIDSALDREHPERLTPEQVELMEAPIVPGRSEAATQDTPRTKYAKISETLTPDQIAAIHQALRMIADLDGDHAKVLNGIGFSRLDGMIGHSLADCGRLTPKQAALAQTLVRKYRRQVPDALLVECGL